MPRPETTFQSKHLWIATSVVAWLACPAYADQPNTNAPDHGYVIELGTPDGIPQKSGQTAFIEGAIRAVGLHFPQGKGVTSKSLTDLLTGDGVQVRAFFPDYTQEVSSSLKLSASKGQMDLQYTTPTLNATDLNVLIIQVSQLPPDVRALQNLQAKVDRRIAALGAWIAKLTNQNVAGTDLTYLNALLQQLQSLSSRIGQRLARETRITAEERFPLQIDNQIAAGSLNSTVMGKFRLTISESLGSAIQGERTKIHGEILNLRNPGDLDDSSRWIAQFLWQGAQVQQIGPQAIPGGASVSHDYSTGKLQPTASNTFSESIRSVDSEDGGAISPGHLFGSLALAEPVAVDNVPPNWLPGSTPDSSHVYVQNPQPVSASVQDSFGLVDPASFQFLLTGTLNDGTTFNQNVTSQLPGVSPDQGQTYQISGGLGTLAEGLYTFSMTAQDLAGNYAAPDPLSMKFRVDRTPPQITLSQSGSQCTAQPASNFDVSVMDWSPITNLVSDNGTPVVQNNASPASLSVSQTYRFPVQVALTPGWNRFGISSTDAAGNNTTQASALNILYITSSPVITLGSADGIHTDKPAYSLPIAVSDIGSVSTQVFQNGTLIATSSQSSFTVDATLVEQINTFRVQSVDCAGNTSTAQLNNIYLDTTPPVIALGASDHQLTRTAAFTLPVTVADDTPTDTRVLQNGVQIYESSSPSFSVSATLKQGLNIFEVDSVDAAGNPATPAVLSDITLDTTPPSLLSISPAQNAIIESLSVPVSGQASEPLSEARVNGQALALSADQKSFSGSIGFPSEGTQTLDFEIADLAGNTFSQQVTIQISLRVLYGNLIMVAPDLDGVHLNILGAAGSTLPGNPVSATASFFNSASTTSGSDGSFKIQLVAFTQATVSATAHGRTDTATVTYGAQSGTLLSGMVKDVGGNPLSGVTVGIAGTPVTPVVTDGTGVFTFTQPVTGDQTLVVDGTTVPALPPPAPQRKFSVTHVAVNIGLTQNNVLPRPIYLVPIPLDGSATQIDSSTGGMVTSASAPGVELNIPSGAAHFPDGSTSGSISITQIPAQYSTIQTPPFAEPDQVVSLEPSGMTFSQRVGLTLPNDNNLPPGVTLLIWSMNSNKGVWEIDGIADVTSDGQSVVTRPGQGISHFSLVFSAPLGPKVAQLGSQAKPGADTFNGSLTRGIQLPSFKSLGQSVTPQLTYKSAWAKPTALVTDTFSIPREEATFQFGAAGGIGTLIRVEVGDTLDTWWQPDHIGYQFLTTSIITAPSTFSGNIPNDAVISYAVDMKDPGTGSYLPSDIYPYTAKFDVYLKHVIIHTTTTRKWKFFGGPDVSTTRADESVLISQAYPNDLSGLIYVQNEINSPAGRGWRISGAQRIINPTSNNIMLEEADGSIAGYVVNNTIQTLFDAGANGMDVSRAADVSSWPNAYFMNQAGQSFYGTDLSSASPSASSSYGTVPAVSGMLAGYNYAIYPFLFNNLYYCEAEHYSYSFDDKPEQLFSLGNGTIVGTDSDRHVVFQLNHGGYGYLSGSLTNARTIALSQLDNTSGPTFLKRAIENYCSNTPGFSCSIDWGVANLFAQVNSNPFQACTTYLGAVQSQGLGPNPGMGSDGAVGPAQFNAPSGIASGPKPDTILIADTGNNRVRLIDLNTQQITTIAGNGQNFDNGDGGLAVNASIYHPRGVTSDAAGNIYISTDHGQVRVVDTTGRISSLAGDPAQDPTPGDNLPAGKVLLINPYGVAVDNTNGYLYIAETGANVIRRVDLATHMITTVAGNPNTGLLGDGGAALNASLSGPKFIGLDPDSNLVIVDAGHQRIRRVIFQNTSGGTLTFAPQVHDNSILARNVDGSFTRTYRNGTQVLFNPAGFETLVQDRVGRQTSYTYDSQNKLTTIQDPVGQKLQYYYSGGMLSSIADPASRTTNFFYDSNNDLVGVSFPDGSQKKYSYDSKGLMTGETDQRNNTTQYTYNEWSRLQQVTYPDNSTVIVNDVGSATAANSYTGGNVGQLKSYNPGQNQLSDSVTDARSITTGFTKDQNGYITTIVDALGRKTTIQRDLNGNPTLVTRPDGTTASFTYDPVTQDLLSQTDSATGITTSQTYDRFGSPLAKISGLRHQTTYIYDPNTGLLVSSADPLGHGTTYTYNSLGLTTSAVNSLGIGLSYIYDSYGNVTSVTDSLGHPAGYTYDAAGNVLTRTNANNETTQYSYDAFNRLLSVTTPKGETTHYTYLPTGELYQITDPKNNVTTYQYDALGRVIQKTDPLGYVTARSYDGNGNLVQEVDPNGNVKSFTYDNANRLIQKTLPDDVISLSYDTKDNITQARNSASLLTFSYDAGERLVSAETQGQGNLADMPSVTLTYTWDQDNNRIQLSDPAGNTSYSYDAADRLISLTNPKGENFSFGIDGGNRIISISRSLSSTQVITQFTFDNANFMSQISHSSGGTTLARFVYQRDSLGNTIGIQTTGGINRSLAYDADDQLSSATNPETKVQAMQAETFAYDSISNRTQDQGGSYTYDQYSIRLMRDYRYIYVYDNNGNLTSKQEIGFGATTNYFYSSENQLMGFKVYPAGSSAPSKEVSYEYDAMGRRIQKHVVDYTAQSDPAKTYTRRYVYDGQDILLEYDGDNKLLARYTHSGLHADDVLAVDVQSQGVDEKVAQNPGTYVYLKDQLGSITDVADTSGNKIEHYVYSAYGELLQIENGAGADAINNPPLSTTYTFTGREYDSESGLYYYRARYYDPGTGRFLQQDPEPGKLNLPATVVNSYIYALNNPANRVDPSGRFSLFEDLFIGLAAITVAVIAVVLAPFTLGGSAVLGGIVEGALVGALVGGAVGAGINIHDNRPWNDNIWQAIGIGAVAGAAAGGITAGIMSSSATTSASGQLYADAGNVATDGTLTTSIASHCAYKVVANIGLTAIGGWIITLPPPPVPQIFGGALAAYGAFNATTEALSCF